MPELGEALSERELDVLNCLASGAPNKQIAADLSISQNTVKVHLRNIYAKLGVSSRTEATTAAIQQGFISVTGQSIETAVPPTITTIPTDPIPESAIETEVTAVAPPRPRRNWRVLTLVLLLIFSLIVIALLGLQVVNQRDAATTPEPFVETSIGDTRWSTSRAMPEGRSNMAVAVVGLGLYQIGGETAAGVDGRVQIFDSRDHTWQDAAEKPTAVADVTAAELYGEIYVPGGRLADGQPTNIVEVYSPAQDAWRPIAALPQPVAGGLTLTDGAFLYLFGGWDGTKVLDTTYVYDPGADRWRPLATMPQARAFATGGELSNQFTIVGGQDGDKALQTCQQFEPVTETWTKCPNMLQARSGAGATVLLNKLYVIGGEPESDEPLKYSEVYDPGSETWQVLNTPMLDDKGKWPHIGVSQIETRIYTLGGRQDETFLAANYVYAPLVYQTFIPAASSSEEE